MQKKTQKSELDKIIKESLDEFAKWWSKGDFSSYRELMDFCGCEEQEKDDRYIAEIIAYKTAEQIFREIKKSAILMKNIRGVFEKVVLLDFIQEEIKPKYLGDSNAKKRA